MTPEEVLALIRSDTGAGVALLDVRSEGEFVQGSIPGFINAPILNDAERHAVGTAYKREGQERAIALGHELTAPHRDARIAAWRAAILAAPGREGVVTCWRGGLRSELAAAAIAANGMTVRRVAGGYRALRHALTSRLAHPPELIVLAGLTGSGKTRLIREIGAPHVVDLEACARHRGSSYGAFHAEEQPSQATFENAIGLALLGAAGRVLLEDESAAVGRVVIPPPLRARMAEAPVVLLECDLETRIANIFSEYVTEPLARGLAPKALLATLRDSTHALRRRLGGELATRLDGELVLAFQGAGPTLVRLSPWIRTLLSAYYDPTYQFGFARRPRQVAFQGSYEECRQWISTRFA